jgi:uncharacterized membrane protein
MAVLILGLVLFLGTHVFAMFRGARIAVIGRIGEKYYKLGFTVLSALGLVLIVVGFGRYRAAGEAIIWNPPLWLHDVTAALMWLAFIALACMGGPPGRIKGALHHPMLVGIKLWAFAHLLSNGDVGGILLFGAFSVKRRGDLGAQPVARFTRADAISVLAGSVAFLVVFWLHRYLIGVPVYLT